MTPTSSDEWCDPVITKAVISDETISAKTIGAERVLNDCFKETLIAIDDLNHTFSYSIDGAPGTPVDDAKGYVGTWKFHEVTNPSEGKEAQTFLTISSVWVSGDSQAILDFCDPVYQGALKALKANAEKEE